MCRSSLADWFFGDEDGDENIGNKPRSLLLRDGSATGSVVLVEVDSLWCRIGPGVYPNLNGRGGGCFPNRCCCCGSGCTARSITLVWTGTCPTRRDVNTSAPLSEIPGPGDVGDTSATRLLGDAFPGLYRCCCCSSCS